MGGEETRVSSFPLFSIAVGIFKNVKIFFKYVIMYQSSELHFNKGICKKEIKMCDLHKIYLNNASKLHNTE